MRRPPFPKYALICCQPHHPQVLALLLEES